MSFSVAFSSACLLAGFAAGRFLPRFRQVLCPRCRFYLRWRDRLAGELGISTKRAVDPWDR